MNGLANHPSIVREAADLKKKNITTTDGALQNMLSRGIDPYLAQAVVSQMQMQAAAPMQNIRPPQGTVVDKTLGMGLPSMPEAQNIGARGFADGGIVAFTPENEGNEGQLVRGDEDEDFASRVGRSTAAQNAAMGEGILNYGKNALYSTVTPGAHLVDKFRKLLKKDPDTGRYYLGSKPDHTYRSDKEAWADFSKNTQGIMSGISPSAEELKNAPKDRVTRAPRIAPKDTADFMQRAADWQHGLSPASTNLFAPPTPFAMGPQSPLMGGDTSTPPSTSAPPIPAPSAPAGSTRTSVSARSPFADISDAIKKEESAAGTDRDAQEQAYKDYLERGGGKAEDTLATFMRQYAGKALTKDANKKQAVIDAGLAMLTSASERGANFLGSVGAGAKAGVSGYRERDKEQEKKALDLAKMTYEVESAKEKARLGAYKEGSAKWQHQQDKIFELKGKQLDANVKLALAQYEIGGKNAAYKTMEMGGIPRPFWPAIEEMGRIALDPKRGTNDPRYKELREIVRDAGGVTTGVMKTEISADAGVKKSESSARQKALTSPLTQSAMSMFSAAELSASRNPNDEKAQQRLAGARSSLQRTLSMNGFKPDEIAEILGGGGGGVGTGSAPNNGVEFIGFKK